MSLIGTYVECKETLASILNAKGVNANANMGLTTLINSVGDIAPEPIGLLAIDTSVSLTVDSATVHVNDYITCTGVLKCFYDDTTELDVDLPDGRLRGGLIKIMTGDTVIATGFTNNNGEYSIDARMTNTGDYNVRAVFEGSTAFSECGSSNSSVSVTEPEPEVLTLVSDRDLVQTSGDSGHVAVLTATLSDGDGLPVAGKSIVFKVDGTVVDTIVTDVDGVAEYTYTAQAVSGGVVEISASFGSSLIETCQIYDFILNDTAEQNNLSKYTISNLTVTHDSTNKYYNIQHTQNATGGITFAMPEDIFDFVFEAEVKCSSRNPSSGGYNFFLEGYTLPNQYVGVGSFSTQTSLRTYNSTVIDHATANMMAVNVWYKLRLIYQNNKIKGEIIRLSDDSVLLSHEIDYTFEFVPSFYLMILMCASTHQIKNIRLKRL